MTKCIEANNPSATDVQPEEWIPVAYYAPEFLDTELDIPDTMVDQNFFASYTTMNDQQGMIQDIMLANMVTNSGVPNRFGLRIPVKSNWNVEMLDKLLTEYDDRDILEWITFGFSVSRQDDFPDPTPNTTNHLGATLYPDSIDAYIDTELRLGAAIGPFTVPPFIRRIGISPLSTRPKKDSNKRRIILDLSFPLGSSVNDGINKDSYCGEPIKLTYPTIDTLAKRISEIGLSCRLWKKDMIRAFRQIPLCPREYSLIGYR